MATLKVAESWFKMQEVIKVLWFSRHTMTREQETALFIGIAKHLKSDLRATAVIITQISETINSTSEIEGVDEYDIYAIVAPITLQQQFLKIAGNKPVIMAKSDRVIQKTPEGEDKISFVFNKWERLKKIEVVIEDF